MVGITFPMSNEAGWQRARIRRIPNADYVIEAGWRVLPAEHDLSLESFNESQKQKRDLRSALGQSQAYRFTQTMLGILFRNRLGDDPASKNRLVQVPD